MTALKQKSYDVSNQTIADALGTDSVIYTIPQFQRKYAWTKKEIDDLLFDLFEEVDWSNEDLSDLSSHFLGSVVIAAVEEADMVLDGQQRLASISLLLSVIKKKLMEESSEKVGSVDKYLMKVSRKLREDNQIRLQLQPEDSEAYKSLIRDPTKCKSKDIRDSLIAKATQAILEKVDSYLKKAEALGVSREVALLSMLERTLDHTTLVKIVAPSEADAFRLFETLNDRGLALNAADLIKNKLLAKCREKRNIDEAVEIWKQIIDLVGESEIVSFLRYYYIAFYSNVRQRELYKVFEIQLNKLSPPQALNFARDLKKSARFYSQIMNPSEDTQIWKSGVIAVLRRLLVYKARSCRSALLACAEHRPEDMLKVVTAFETITIRYSVVSNLGSNDLERSYSQLARALKPKQKNVEDVLETYLNAHSLSDEDFKRNFSELSISSVSEVWRQVLIQLNEDLSTGETTVRGAQEVHVEHIFPRKPSSEASRESRIQNKEEIEKFSRMIGNLTLLSGDYNRKISNHAFSSKKSAFKGSQIAFNIDIANKTQWRKEEIIERSEFLGALATRVWCWPIK